MQRDQGLPKLLTRKQLAELFQTSEAALAVQHTNGYLDLPYTRRGARIYYFESDVLAYLEKNRVLPGAMPKPKKVKPAAAEAVDDRAAG